MPSISDDRSQLEILELAIVSQLLRARSSVVRKLELRLPELVKLAQSSRLTSGGATRLWLIAQPEYQSLVLAAQTELLAAASQSALAFRQYAAKLGVDKGELTLFDAQRIQQTLLTPGVTISLLEDAGKQMELRLSKAVLSDPKPAALSKAIQTATLSAVYRARTIARTEAYADYRQATLEAYRQTTGRKVIGWIWETQANPCFICQDKAGSFHPISEPFVSHPNCRCVPRPVYEEE